jgi:hypothetical protein
MSETVKVGDKVFLFDGNRRIYRKDRLVSSSPIYREHFVERLIVGETRVSWIVGMSADTPWTHAKYPKKFNPHRRFWRADQIDAAVWAHDNRYEISQEIQRIDEDLLRKVADLIGYKEKGGKA